MRRKTRQSLVQIGFISMRFYSKLKCFHFWKCTWKCHLRNDGHLVWAPHISKCIITCTCMRYRGDVSVYEWIITLVRHKKCLVRQQNAWFDTKKARFDKKMPGSTQKCPPQHAPFDIASIKHQTFFSNFIPIFCFQEPIEKWKWNYIDMNSN